MVLSINENPSKLAVYLRHKLKIQSIINKDDAYVRNRLEWYRGEAEKGWVGWEKANQQSLSSI